MLDIDYLGEVNEPDALPGLCDQVPRMYVTVELPISTRLSSPYDRLAPVLGTYRTDNPAGNTIVNYGI
eukprot:5709426-Pleurochrysis_carterae.AAC.4